LNSAASTVSSVPKLTVRSAPSFPAAHTLQLKLTDKIVSQQVVSHGCGMLDETGTPTFSVGADGTNPPLPVTDASLVFTNSSSVDLLLTFVIADAPKAGLDGNLTEILPTIAQDVQFANTQNLGWGGPLVLVAAGKSVALDIPAHAQPALPHTVTLAVRCDSREAVEVPINGLHPFQYGGGARYELGHVVQ
jgi:hypothetical protein